MNDYQSKRQKLDVLEAQLREEYESFRSWYQDLSRYILPRRSRFFLTEVNRANDRRSPEIIDSTASMASRTLASGMMTGVTSPARSWFKLKTNLESLNKSSAAKLYFKEVEDSMRAAFLKTNLYNQLPVVYGDLGTFATGLLFMEEDLETVANFYALPIGSYMIANDKRGRATVFFREFQMTVRQIVEKFGKLNKEQPQNIFWDNISDSVKESYMNGHFERYVDIAHFITPNENYRPNSLESKFKKFSSCYYERGFSARGNIGSTSSGSLTKFLSEKGYDYFPAMAVRWEVTGEDTWGTNCPGMLALGDVKQLQLGEKRIAQAIEHKINPAMIGPSALKNMGASSIPGSITFLDEREGTKGFRRMFEVDFDARELEGKQNQLRERISRLYYEDLFLMLAQSDRRQITATEIVERREEKLLALGPVLERVNQDLLDPLIENMFSIMQAQGLLPEAPEELQDKEYTIEYISVLAQAQKLAGVGNIERYLGFVGQAAGLNPNALLKVNIEKTIERYADQIGVDPDLVVSEDEVNKIKEAQAMAQANEQAKVEAAQAIEAGKSLSETKTNQGSLLDDILGGGASIE